MIIANRGGHTKTAPGALDKIDELTEDRKVYKRVQELLAEVGNTMLDCTPPQNYSFPDELNYGINKCNGSLAELFYSIHFNSTQGAYGSEVLIYPGTQLTTDIGNRILSNLASLGFYNRGLKPRTDLGEITSINCPSMIIEVCFVHEKDANLYNSLGVEKVARAIANGIDGRVNLNKGEEYYVDNIVVYMNDIDKRAAEYLADYLVCPIMDGRRAPFDYSRIKNVYCVGGEKGQFTSYCTKHIAGDNRYNTMQAILNFIEYLKKINI
ncbi:MAG: N-acetylmuramoyl-L-alanine amidase [Clostridium sp.]|nr:N-acetylmuramoyl-L-alanine amidase [Clostridium sp.]